MLKDLWPFSYQVAELDIEPSLSGCLSWSAVRVQNFQGNEGFPCASLEVIATWKERKWAPCRPVPALAWLPSWSEQPGTG